MHFCIGWKGIKGGELSVLEPRFVEVVAWMKPCGEARIPSSAPIFRWA